MQADGDRAVLLTGTTGLVGGDLLGRVLAAWPDATAYCLIRARDAAHLEARREALLDRIGIVDQADRVVALAGDVSKPGLGLSEAEAGVAERTAHVFHAAAATRFDLPLADARALNVEGTRRVLDFARRAQRAGSLERVHYVSTAYVAGDRAGVLDESAADAPGPFRNGYEQSKWEADRLVQDASGDLPATCYRPSIIVGDSRTGATPHFRVLYDPMKWILYGKIDILPCHPEVRVDIVPVDWACDAITALALDPRAEGRVLHVTSGPENASCIGEILDLTAVAVNDYEARHGLELSTKPRLVSPDDDSDPAVAALFEAGAKAMRTHLPYMLTEQLFDTASSDALLEGAIPRCPALRDYLATLIDYAMERRFGVR
ncbi:MAG: SDR family oxidoreductase [Deltaproteobacteria bacterium]|nr:SDR family oxidoreductase [Deltaproteobacteria bacterium]MBW2414391.1 SDR family oxidoreductase [Deltaproteobacteria bacterium]